MFGTRQLLRFVTLVVPAVAALLILNAPNTAQATPAVCPPPAEAPAPAATTMPASPQEVVIACVGTQAISEATFDHWREVAAADEPGAKHHPSTNETLVQVMGFLLSAAWVQGEAKALHVHVSRSAVRRQFEKIRRAQFPRKRDFKRFLKETKQTVADLLTRVELDMLSQRIQRRIAAGHRGPKAQREALEHFVKHFREKWTNQTYCAPAYAVKDCGHVQANL